MAAMQTMRRGERRHGALRQRGVAVITALLLTTLAVTIVASLFWQQQVQVRSMENQRLHLQTEWILRGALDWARLILRQDGADSGNVTALSGVWATPLAETRLDDYIERERVNNEKYDATLSGQITDAQGRFNLTNLANARQIDPAQEQVFGRLLQNLQLDSSLAQTVAEAVARTQQAAPAPPNTNGQGSATPTPTTVTSKDPGGAAEPMPMMRVEDLLAVSGFTQEAIERLRDYVIVLPAATQLNVNTAPPELLAALSDNMSVSEAQAMASTRLRTYYRNLGDFQLLMNGHTLTLATSQLDVKSNYFLVLSRVRLDRAALDTQALVQRVPAMGMKTSLIWIREN
jgi:general secretion pathway protein K